MHVFISPSKITITQMIGRSDSIMNMHKPFNEFDKGTPIITTRTHLNITFIRVVDNERRERVQTDHVMYSERRAAFPWTIWVRGAAKGTWTLVTFLVCFAVCVIIIFLFLFVCFFFFLWQRGERTDVLLLFQLCEKVFLVSGEEKGNWNFRGRIVHQVRAQFTTSGEYRLGESSRYLFVFRAKKIFYR